MKVRYLNLSIRNLRLKVSFQASEKITPVNKYFLFSGVLHDPFNEFLVAVDLQIPVEHFWTSRYRLNREFIPSFVSQNQAEKILLIGKSINFLREVCNQPDCEIKAPPHLDEQIGNDLKGDVEERLKRKFYFHIYYLHEEIC